VHDGRGKPKSILVRVNTDITEKKNWRRSSSVTTTGNIGMLASGIAHDLNNVLAPIMMGVPCCARVWPTTQPTTFSTLWSEAPSGAQTGEPDSFVCTRRRRRDEADPVEASVVDIERLVRETFPKSIRFEKDMPTDLWVLQGNPTQLHQVLLNLCVNAATPCPRRHVVYLSPESAADSRGVAPASGFKTWPYVGNHRCGHGPPGFRGSVGPDLRAVFTTKEPAEEPGWAWLRYKES